MPAADNPKKDEKDRRRAEGGGGGRWEKGSIHHHFNREKFLRDEEKGDQTGGGDLRERVNAGRFRHRGGPGKTLRGRGKTLLPLANTTTGD